MPCRRYNAIVVPFRHDDFRVLGLVDDHVSHLELQRIGRGRDEVFFDSRQAVELCGRRQRKHSLSAMVATSGWQPPLLSQTAKRLVLWRFSSPTCRALSPGHGGRDLE